jgi:hypothetical protein
MTKIGKKKLEIGRSDISKPKLQNLRMDRLTLRACQSNLKFCNFGFEMSDLPISNFF